MDDSFTIRLSFAGKVYKFTCKRSEESLARKAARRVEELISQYNRHFDLSKIEEKDILAWVAFHLAFENKMENEIEDISPLFAGLDKLSFKIDEYIRSDK
jgi:hypothetical protein